jgi:trigger factor
MIVKDLDTSEKNTAKFKVEIDHDEFEKAVNAAYRRKKNSISIAGFRKGKAPRAIIEGMYGHDVFYPDAMDSLAPEALRFGIKDKDLRIVGMPELSDENLDDDKNLTFSFTVTLYPEAELGQYTEIELEKEKPEVSDDEVQKEIEAVRKRNARYVPVTDRAAEMGDRVNLVYTATVDGEVVNETQPEGENLELNENSEVLSFVQQIVGMKTGEEKEFDLPVPEENEQFGGKIAKVKAKINTIDKEELPEIDDEFAKDVSEFDTLEEYKEDVRNQILKRKESEADAKYRESLLRIAAHNMKVDIPDVMIDEEEEREIRFYLTSYFGMDTSSKSISELRQMLNIDDETYNGKMRKSAEEVVIQQILLDAIAKKEAFGPTDEQIDAFIEENSLNDIGGKDKISRDEVLARFGEEELKEEVLNELSRKKIFDTAKDVAGKKLEDYIPEEEQEKNNKSEEAENAEEEKPKAEEKLKKKTKKAEKSEKTEDDPKGKEKAKKSAEKSKGKEAEKKAEE